MFSLSARHQRLSRCCVHHNHYFPLSRPSSFFSNTPQKPMSRTRSVARRRTKQRTLSRRKSHETHLTARSLPNPPFRPLSTHNSASHFKQTGNPFANAPLMPLRLLLRGLGMHTWATIGTRLAGPCSVGIASRSFRAKHKASMCGLGYAGLRRVCGSYLPVGEHQVSTSISHPTLRDGRGRNTHGATLGAVR